MTENPAKPMVAVIAGATATGKSAAAIAVAQALNGTIINADASQVYADLRILSARPGDDDLARVPHRLYGVLDGARACSAAEWAAMARAEVDAALVGGRLPVIVGGTGLYLRTLIDGIAPVPEIDTGVRAEVRGLDGATTFAALEREDPTAAARLHAADRQRVSRALEVVRSTGKSLEQWQRETSGGIGETHQVVGVVIDCERTELRARCDARVDLMLATGAIEEVALLLARGLPDELPVMRAIGVAPLAALLAGKSTLQEARDAVANQTRRYAKRQSTWFRNQTPEWRRYLGDLININKLMSEYFTEYAVRSTQMRP